MRILKSYVATENVKLDILNLFFENMVQTAELLWLFILDCSQPEHFENISIWLAVISSRYSLVLLKITV